MLRAGVRHLPGWVNAPAPTCAACLSNLDSDGRGGDVQYFILAIFVGLALVVIAQAAAQPGSARALSVLRIVAGLVVAGLCALAALAGRMVVAVPLGALALWLLIGRGGVPSTAHPGGGGGSGGWPGGTSQSSVRAVRGTGAFCRAASADVC